MGPWSTSIVFQCCYFVPYRNLLLLCSISDSVATLLQTATLVHLGPKLFNMHQPCANFELDSQKRHGNSRDVCAAWYSCWNECPCFPAARVEFLGLGLGSTLCGI